MKNKVVSCLLIILAMGIGLQSIAQPLSAGPTPLSYPPISDCIRAYNVTITGEKATPFSFVCFYKHSKNEKEMAVYFYGSNGLQFTNWSFEGYGETPPNKETLSAQDKASVEHLMEKRKIADPKGVVLKSISVADAKKLFDSWLQDGQPK